MCSCIAFETYIVSDQSYTLPYCHRRNIVQTALSPRGNLLLTVDEDGRAILANLPRRIALYHFSFDNRISALVFSPTGHYFAAGSNRYLEIWHTPDSLLSTSQDGLEFAPFVRHRIHAGHHDRILHIEWSSDARFLLSSSKDLTTRIWSLNAEHSFSPTTLAGHRESVLGAWFSHDQENVSSTDSPNAALNR